MMHVEKYLGVLEARGEIEFDGFSDKWETKQQLKKVIEPRLVEMILKRPSMKDEEIRGRIERLTDKRLEEVLVDS